VNKPRFSDLPRFPVAQFAVDYPWHHIERVVCQAVKEDGLDLDPDFQRGHVWTDAQASAYIEYCLYGGDKTARTIRFNCPRFMAGDHSGPYVIIDGLQRLTAIRRFMRGEVRAFGHLLHEYADQPSYFDCSVHWQVLELPTRAEVLDLYLRINAGGTPHPASEIDRVRALLTAEQGASHG
jgi:hypothetical protein